MPTPTLFSKVGGYRGSFRVGEKSKLAFSRRLAFVPFLVFLYDPLKSCAFDLCKPSAQPLAQEKELLFSQQTKPMQSSNDETNGMVSAPLAGSRWLLWSTVFTLLCTTLGVGVSVIRLKSSFSLICTLFSLTLTSAQLLGLPGDLVSIGWVGVVLLVYFSICSIVGTSQVNERGTNLCSNSYYETLLRFSSPRTANSRSLHIPYRAIAPGRVSFMGKQLPRSGAEALWSTGHDRCLADAAADLPIGRFGVPSLAVIYRLPPFTRYPTYSSPSSS